MSEDNILPIEPIEQEPAVNAVEPEPVPAPAVEPEPAPAPVIEPEPLPVPEPTPAVAVEPVVVEDKPAKPKASSRQAVSGNDKDDVFLSNCVYKNVYARKSLTVHHVQRRLTDLGYKEAYADKDGWLGDLTKLAITNFQKDKGLNATGTMDADTFTKLFEGDDNVNVVL